MRKKLPKQGVSPRRVRLQMETKITVHKVGIWSLRHTGVSESYFSRVPKSQRCSQRYVQRWVTVLGVGLVAGNLSSVIDALWWTQPRSCSSLNHIAHRYRFDKYRVFEQRLIRPSAIDALWWTQPRLWDLCLRHDCMDLLLDSSRLQFIYLYSATVVNLGIFICRKTCKQQIPVPAHYKKPSRQRLLIPVIYPGLKFPRESSVRSQNSVSIQCSQSSRWVPLLYMIIAVNTLQQRHYNTCKMKPQSGDTTTRCPLGKK